MTEKTGSDLPKDWNKFFKDEKFVKTYELGEKVTRVFGEELVNQSGVVADSKSHRERPLVVLDNACGTGAVSSVLQRDLDDETKSKWRLICGDYSEAMLEYTRRRIDKEGWVNTEVKQVDAQDTKLPSNHFTHVFTSFAYMALPKSLDAVDETIRILQPGGIIAFTTWIDPSWIQVVGKAVATISNDLPWPSAHEFLGMLSNGEWNSVNWIESELKSRNLSDIQVNAVTKINTLPVVGFVDMAMFMVPMIIEHFWSEKMRRANQEKIKPALAKYLVDTYGEDGQVSGGWQAIVSTARKPGTY